MNVAIDAPLTDRERFFSVAVVIIAAFLVGIAFSIGYPLAALNFEQWGQPTWVIGLVGSTPALGVLSALPFIPRIVGRIGPTASMTLGYLLGALGFLALSLFPSPWAWIVIRFAMNGAMAIPWLTGETWINSVAPDAWRARVIAGYAIAFFSGFAVGPLLLQKIGISGYLPFLLGAGVTGFCAIPILAARRVAPNFVHGKGENILSACRLAPAATIGGFIVGFVEITSVALLPNVALANGLGAESALGILSTMTVGGVVLQIPMGWLADRYEKTGVLVCVTISLMALFVLLKLSLGIAMVAGLVTFAIGGLVVGVYTLGLGIIGDRVPRANLASANAAFLVLYQVGAISGPLVSGIIMMVAPASGFVATEFAVLAVSALFLLILRQNPR